jgi:pimeloyl-ACP methyl ester carboxylesterase
MWLRRWFLAVATFGLGVAACSAPVALLTPTLTAAPATQVPGHIEPPTAADPTAGIESRTINCASPDGVPLAATLYGRGTTAVIFSNRSDKGRDSWATLALRAAASGYLAVTYDYRAFNSDGSVDIGQLNLANIDLRGVIACAKLQGAQSIVLAGASIGGMASAKEAAAAHAAALIIVGSPLSNPDLTLNVSPAELQNAIPKLFIASEHDALVPAAETQAMYQAAAEPKTFYQYPTDAHGTDLLLGALAEDFQQRLLAFISAHAPIQT